MPSHRKLVYILLCALASTTYADDKACTLHDNGRYFDLTALKSSKDYHVVDGGHDDIFPINVCQSVKTETYGVKDGTISDNEIAGFIRRGHGDFVIGKINTTLGIYNNRPRLVLSGGSRCRSGNDEALDIRGSTIVDFICDAKVFGPGQPRLVAQLPPGDNNVACAFVIEWTTHHACPIGESGLVWTIFVFLAVTFLTILTIYTVLGTLYNRYVLQLRGFDQIPQFSIESMKYHSGEAIDWLRDVAAGLDIPGSQGGGAFRSSNNSRTLNPYSHQAQSGGHDDDDEASIGFSRPSTLSSGRKPETNPVSHHSHFIAETQRSAGGGGGSLSFAAAAPTTSTSLLTTPIRTKLEVRKATPAERQYMLGDDEEDEDEEEEDEDEEDEEDEDEDTLSQGPHSRSHQGSTQPTLGNGKTRQGHL